MTPVTFDEVFGVVIGELHVLKRKQKSNAKKFLHRATKFRFSRAGGIENGAFTDSRVDSNPFFQRGNFRRPPETDLTFLNKACWMMNKTLLLRRLGHATLLTATLLT